MKKTLLLASLVFGATQVIAVSPCRLSLKTVQSPLVCSSTVTEEGTIEIMLDEDFSLLTSGSESAPTTAELNDDDYIVPVDKTHAPGWMGYYLHEAGGSLYIGLDAKEIETGAVNTPYMDLTRGGGAYTVTFKAKSKMPDYPDRLMVVGKKTASDYKAYEVKLSNEWQSYSIKFDNGCDRSYIMFSPIIDGAFIDDVKVEVLVPFVMAPKNPAFTNYTGDGFTAAWEGVDGAQNYLLSVYTKDSEGNRSYYLEKHPVEGLSYGVSGLPKSDSFYYFMVQATDGVHVSPESVEVAVEGLLVPVLKSETNVGAKSFTANWNAVEHASTYDFIVTREHKAAEVEAFDIINENFDAITETGSTYDYTSIPQLPGWTIASPTFLPGAIGVKSANGQYSEDAWIQSSIYDFSNDGGKVHIKMNLYCNHKKYTSDVLIGLFTYSEADKRFKVTDYTTIKSVGKDVQNIDIVLNGGGSQSILQIEPDGYADMIIDDLIISQNLAAGDEIAMTVVSKSTDQTSQEVSDLKLADGDKVRYKVRAVGRNSSDTGNIYSEYTEPRYVDLVSSAISEIMSDNPGESYVVYNLQGVKVLESESEAALRGLPAGLYIVNGRKMMVR